MDLDFRKKSKRDRIIRSKSFETQEVREIGRKEVERLFHLMDWNNRKCLSDGSKEMRRPRKIKMCGKKSRKVL